MSLVFLVFPYADAVVLVLVDQSRPTWRWNESILRLGHSTDKCKLEYIKI